MTLTRSILSLMLTALSGALTALALWCVGAQLAWLHVSPWLMWAGALLIAPVAPLFWEWCAAAQPPPATRDPLATQPARSAGPKRRLALWARLRLRALLISALTLAALWGWRPAQSATALRERPDWMIPEDRASDQRQRLSWARQGLAKAAQGVDRLHEEAQLRRRQRRASADLALKRWPLQATPHPLATAQALRDASLTLEALARALREGEPEPAARARAAHDWIALHIAYDMGALGQDAATRRRHAQPEEVLRRRLATSEGYARLMQRLGELVGLEVVLLRGVTRRLDGALAPGEHAWNAVRLDGQWRLVDVAWDAGSARSANAQTNTQTNAQAPAGAWAPGYRVDYLWTPPEVFIMDHLPDDPAWQLLSSPLSPEAFERQPMLRPTFFAAGLSLTSPRRGQVEASGAVMITLEAPEAFALAAKLHPHGERCSSQRQGASLTFTCALPATGTTQVQLYGGPAAGPWPLLGSLRVTARPVP